MTWSDPEGREGEWVKERKRNKTIMEGIKGDVNVGIGTTIPGYTLDVSGDVNTTDCYKEDGAQVAGTCASDLRLKKNFRYLDIIENSFLSH